MSAELRDVQFAYSGINSPTFVIESFVVAAGETVVLTGESGAGKSTLLGLISGVMPSSSGTVSVAGQVISERSGAFRDRIRADHIGYIFQRSNLLPFLSPRENVLLAGQFSASRRTAAGQSTSERREHAEHLLERLGVSDIDRAASTLSVGQQQRVAAARALFGGPALLVADEPTAALDKSNSERFFELFLGEAKRLQAGALVVSHDPAIVPLFDKHVELGSIAKWEQC